MRNNRNAKRFAAVSGIRYLGSAARCFKHTVLRAPKELEFVQANGELQNIILKRSEKRLSGWQKRTSRQDSERTA